MKQLTKEIRKEVKATIESVGGTKNLLNRHITEMYEKFTTEEERTPMSDHACDVLTTITNQIDYFKYSRGL